MATRNQQTRIEQDPVFCMPAALTLRPIVAATPELAEAYGLYGHLSLVISEGYQFYPTVHMDLLIMDIGSNECPHHLE